LQPTQVKRTMNYTDVAYTSLLRACESVSFWCRGWQQSNREELLAKDWGEKIQFISRPSSTPARTYRSLQGHWDMIKAVCICCSGCLDQVRNTPPCGCTIDDYVILCAFLHWLCALFH
jgi:hypothetical protein